MSFNLFHHPGGVIFAQFSLYLQEVVSKPHSGLCYIAKSGMGLTDHFLQIYIMCKYIMCDVYAYRVNQDCLNQSLLFAVAFALHSCYNMIGPNMNVHIHNGQKSWTHNPPANIFWPALKMSSRCASIAVPATVVRRPLFSLTYLYLNIGDPWPLPLLSGYISRLTSKSQWEWPCMGTLILMIHDL